MNELSSISMKLQMVIPTLPRTERAVAVYMMEQLEDLGSMDMNLISEKTGSSKPTIIRLCKRLGYDGFLELRNIVRFTKNSQVVSDIAPNYSNYARSLMDDIIKKNSETMTNTLALVSEQYAEVVEELFKNKIIALFGCGDAIMPCDYFALKMMKVGKSCNTYSDQDRQILCASSIQKDSLVIAVSHTGRSKSVVESMKIAYERGATTVGITAFAKCPLLRYCKYTLFTGTMDDSVIGNIISRRVGENLVLETLFNMYINDIKHQDSSLQAIGAETLRQVSKMEE